MSIIKNVLSNEELEYLNNLPEVLSAKTSLDSKLSGMVKFSVSMTDSIRTTLNEKFGLDVSTHSTVPMRWIKGDTSPHIDTGASQFKNTYLIYLNDSPGELIINSQSYSIQSNSGFIFNEGLSHETHNTENVPRLLLGPMNELVEPVGASAFVIYYQTKDDALNYENGGVMPIGYSATYIINDGVYRFVDDMNGGTVLEENITLPYTNWGIAPTSTGLSLQGIPYQSGAELDSTLIDEEFYPIYRLFPYLPLSNPVVYYYNTESDALNFYGVTPLAVSETYIIGSEVYDENGLPVTLSATGNWIIAFTSSGSSPQDIEYTIGTALDSTLTEEGSPPIYRLYLADDGNPPATIPDVYYYATESDALNYQNEGVTPIGLSASYIIGDGVIDFQGQPVTLPYTSWRIASSSDGPSSQSQVYRNGDELDSTLDPKGFPPTYYLYPVIPCFLEGTTILCQVDGIETYVAVEELKKGTLVKTSLDGYKPLMLIGKGTIENPGNDERTENRLYKCSPSIYPELKEDLYITGCHSILEFPITEKQKEDTIKHLGKLFVTDNKYRLMACVDERAEPWNSKGTYTIWHFALENENEKMNYGVYANGGLLVETCSINFLKNKSNMTIM